MNINNLAMDIHFFSYTSYKTNIRLYNIFLVRIFPHSDLLQDWNSF